MSHRQSPGRPSSSRTSDSWTLDMSGGRSCGVGGRKLVWHNGQAWGVPGPQPSRREQAVAPAGPGKPLRLRQYSTYYYEDGDTIATLMMTSFRGIVTRQSSLAKLSADLSNNSKIPMRASSDCRCQQSDCNSRIFTVTACGKKTSIHRNCNFALCKLSLPRGRCADSRLDWPQNAYELAEGHFQCPN